MKKTKLAASLLAVSMLATTVLAGCTPTEEGGNSGNSGNSGGTNSGSESGSGQESSGSSEDNILAEDAAWAQTLTYAADTTVRMACGYDKNGTGMRFTAKVAGDGVTLADGKTYHADEFKPTWVAVMDKLKFKIEDKFQNNSASDEWKIWQPQLDQIDMVCGNATDLTAAGNDGMLLDISKYLDSMPYFSAYLERNPIVRLSVTGSVTGQNPGSIYFSPYFDGVNDIERMPLMRTDWVEKLLDGPADASDITTSDDLQAFVYTPYMPTTGTVSVDVVKLDGSDKETITKDYSKYGNIVAKMNEAGTMNGKDAVKMLREYIDATYNGYYGETRSNLFVGQNAAWDADELVALLRCVVSNSATLNANGEKVQGIFSREDSNNQRRVDMFRFAGTLFGVRGLESRQDYLYVGNDNKLHDARMEADTYTALKRMNDMAKEGLISSSFIESKAEKSETMLKNDIGFMSYDYSQTQTVYNATQLDEGEEYSPAMVPVARWNDGTGEKIMRFTESWRSVKTDGWAISLAGLGYTKDNVPKTAAELNDKAKALLTLIDYAYSHEGQVLMSYGPEAFYSTETFNFNGQEWPKISEASYNSLQELEGGNYTNYARRYVGSTLSFVKSQAFEYQCTNEVGKRGAGYISNAIALGTISHPELALTDNAWYTSVPTVLPLTSAENTDIQSYPDLNTKFSTSKDKQNDLCDLICKGFNGNYTDAAAGAAYVAGIGGTQVLEKRNAAWERLVTYYNSNIKNG